jgi:hypothetical protein
MGIINGFIEITCGNPFKIIKILAVQGKTCCLIQLSTTPSSCRRVPLKNPSFRIIRKAFGKNAKIIVKKIC